ncbi:hypothetical protein BO224_02800 [Erysipelotrichaceae bacterium NYU-BL-E8]|uniref:Uncharacterized protein n=1 Tax=Ileibacterium valens TaxID=1862668 RepID=A0A1U7NDM0_9FIRM|nr:hypothetical protein BO222_10765 [Ileibacterium valens]OLU41886.1 hypothetical protein BO224_02800 [Erysipelotrichaceae bacterium NYU-BL-E8]OLU43008.1 hypothetical protein BM735_01140 [Erysipelotrichaceae bacterium NYU-BL-F16]
MKYSQSAEKFADKESFGNELPINCLKCWKILKRIQRQHNLERQISVNVAKAEKMNSMAYG